MAVFKIGRCPECKAQKNVKTGSPEKCHKCGSDMRISEKWHISYRVAGRKKVEAVSNNKRVAETVLGKRKAEIAENKYLDKAPSTNWSDAVQEFRAWYQVNVKPNTARMYENSLKNLSPHFTHLTLDKITMQMVERFKADRALTVTPATVNRDLATLKRLFSLCEEWGLLDTDRIRRVKLLSEKSQERKTFLSETEMTSLLAECEHHRHLYMAVLISLETGLRKEGVFTLRWPEINFETKMIRKATKGEKEVSIPLSWKLENALRQYRASEKILSQYVLPSSVKHGQPYKDLKKGFKAACRRAGIEGFRWHDLRHTFASHFIMRTGDLRSLKSILGHSSITTTMRYSHLMDEHKRRAMDKFSPPEEMTG